MGAVAVEYRFYLDEYGGALPAEAFAEALPAAVRTVAGITWVREPNASWSAAQADAWRHAVCAAADVYAELGEGNVGGFSIGDFSVTHYTSDGTTVAEMAVDAALAELAGSGLAFSGVR